MGYINILALVLPIQDFIRVIMHLSWKCLGLGLGVEKALNCLVKFTGIKTMKCYRIKLQQFLQLVKIHAYMSQSQRFLLDKFLTVTASIFVYPKLSEN